MNQRTKDGLEWAALAIAVIGLVAYWIIDAIRVNEIVIEGNTTPVVAPVTSPEVFHEDSQFALPEEEVSL